MDDEEFDGLHELRERGDDHDRGEPSIGRWLRQFAPSLPRDSLLGRLIRVALAPATSSMQRDPEFRRLASRLLREPGTCEAAVVVPILRPSIFTVCEDAFIESTVLLVDYESSPGGRTVRTVEPHALLLAPPTWWIVTFDRRRGAIETIRLDCMREAKRLPEVFEPLDRRRLLQLKAIHDFGRNGR